LSEFLDDGILSFFVTCQKILHFCSQITLQQAPTVRIRCLVYNVTNYYSVTDNIIQLLSTFGICC